MSTQLLSARAFRLYRQARELVRRHSLKSDREPGPEHMLLAFVTTGHELFAAVQKSFSIDRTKFERSLIDHTVRAGDESLDVALDNFSREVVRSSSSRRRRIGDEWDLFQAVFRSGSAAIRGALYDTNLSPEKISAVLATPEMQAFILRYEHGKPAPQ